MSEVKQISSLVKACLSAISKNLDFFNGKNDKQANYVRRKKSTIDPEQVSDDIKYLIVTYLKGKNNNFNICPIIYSYGIYHNRP
jgi:hypothetical protein